MQEPCPYKRYCSRVCAEADTHAGVTQVLHQLVAQENTKVEVRPCPSLPRPCPPRSAMGGVLCRVGVPTGAAPSGFG